MQFPASNRFLVNETRRIAEESTKFGRLEVTFPDGSLTEIEGPEPGYIASVHIHKWSFFKTAILEGYVGVSDAYLEGVWSTGDLLGLMDFFYQNDDFLFKFEGSWFFRIWNNLRFLFQRNSKSQAKKNISYHYDLGNDFYKLWLDDTMTYSSAIFETGQESLERAQTTKYKSMVDQMGAKPGDHVLEIGCGWGGFAEYAAKERGLRVTGLTISQEQYDYARQRMKDAGIADQVEIKLQDYRDETGQYDGIASIEMFEAVGEKYWPVYFDALRERLKPGRNATLQIITIEDDRFEIYRKDVDFIQKYIFPGGMLPSPSVLRGEIERAGMNVMKSIEFGESYSQTLRRWHNVFNDRWEDVSLLGFDGRFKRMWNFYLTSCASGFQSGCIDVTQITVTKPG